jgi:hypothetical protein
MITTTDVFNKIRNGDYETKLPYPTKLDKADDRTRILNAYHADNRRLNALFQDEALESVGLKDHPKKDKIFAYAWNEGHSGGLSEVYCHLINLTDLFVD